MKFKYLLYAALASTLTFAACGDDDPIPTPAPEKEPTVAVTAGKADVTSLTFTVTPADAKECRYVCVENIDGFDAEKILAEGTAVAAAEATSVTVEGLAPETEYTILAAVRGGANNDKTALSQVLKMTTLAEPAPEPVKLTLVSADRTSGSDGNFFIRFKDAEDKHIMEVDFYAAADAKYLPAGTYTVSAEDQPGQIGSHYSRIQFAEQSADEWIKFTEGTAEVAIAEDETYTFKMSFTLTDGVVVEAEYTGEVANMSTSLVIDLTATEAVRIHEDKDAGEFYIKLTDGYKTMDGIGLDLYAEASAETLPAGVYTVGEGTEPGTATKKSYAAPYSPTYTSRYFASGTVTVSVEGDVYTFEIDVVDTEGAIIKGHYTGEVKDMKPALVIDLTATEAVRIHEDKDAGEFYIKLTDGYKTMDGIGLDLYAEASAETLPAGVYTVGEGTEPGTATKKSYAAPYSPTYTSRYFASGTVTVSVEGDVYTFEIDVVDTEGAIIKGHYTGEVKDMKPALVIDLTATEAVRIHEDKDAGEFYIKLTDGYKTMDGIGLDLYAEASAETLPAGVYTVGEGTEPGTATKKSYAAPYSPTYTSRYFASGTVTVSVEGDVYTFEIDVVDTEGAIIKGHYTGEVQDMKPAPQIVTIEMDYCTAEKETMFAQTKTKFRFYKGSMLNPTEDIDLFIFYDKGTDQNIVEGVYTFDAAMSRAANTFYTGDYGVRVNGARRTIASGTITVVKNSSTDITGELTFEDGESCKFHWAGSF